MTPIDRYEELHELAESLPTVSITDINSVDELEQIARRSITLVQGWPQEAWQQWEDEHPEQVWPYREHVIESLNMALRSAEVYRVLHPTTPDFEGWINIYREMFGALYYFREINDEDEDE